MEGIARSLEIAVADAQHRLDTVYAEHEGLIVASMAVIAVCLVIAIIAPYCRGVYAVTKIADAGILGRRRGR